MSTGTIPVVLDTSPELPVYLEYFLIVTPAFYIDEAGDIYVNEAGDLYYG